MKKFLMLIIVGVCTFSAISASSGNPGDRILGVYKAVKDGAVSKVRFTKTGENSYRAQVIWLENEKHPDGTLRRDVKNPDPAKRSTPASQIVLIDKVSYVDGEWKNGQVYDPTSGKVYKTVVTFDDDKTLRVRGFLGPFSKSLFWEKLDE